jgi:hypothetical protein
LGYLKERDHLEDLGVDGRIISKYTWHKLEGMTWTCFVFLFIRQFVGCSM